MVLQGVERVETERQAEALSGKALLAEALILTEQPETAYWEEEEHS